MWAAQARSVRAGHWTASLMPDRGPDVCAERLMVRARCRAFSREARTLAARFFVGAAGAGGHRGREAEHVSDVAPQGADVRVRAPQPATRERWLSLAPDAPVSVEFVKVVHRNGLSARDYQNLCRQNSAYITPNRNYCPMNGAEPRGTIAPERGRARRRPQAYARRAHDGGCRRTVVGRQTAADGGAAGRQTLAAEWMGKHSR